MLWTTCVYPRLCGGDGCTRMAAGVPLPSRGRGDTLRHGIVTTTCFPVLGICGGDGSTGIAAHVSLSDKFRVMLWTTCVHPRLCGGDGGTRVAAGVLLPSR